MHPSSILFCFIYLLTGQVAQAMETMDGIKRVEVLLEFWEQKNRVNYGGR
jgi:hypothetical protein